MGRTLVILRHAKAEPGAATDHERALTGRGRRDALAAGRWLAEAKIRPDLAVCSTAARAKETWALAAAEFGDGIATSYERAVYTDESDGLLELLRLTPKKVDTLLLVGHNPSLQDLALDLAGSGSTDDDLRAARENFGTAAIAVFEVDAWADLVTGGAVLTRFTVARG